MTPKEQETAIGELEERVDRLRNLYEQYFLGFEKLEPGVQRKDVDRRFMLLRKEQIRNTAMRFRFNVVTQKFNTYAMHWVRICRQIEDGTYKRHLRKAQAKFGDMAKRPDRDRDFSIDVEMGDFEDDENFDVDRLMAETDSVANEADISDAHDTVPPPPSVQQPRREAPDRTQELARQMMIGTPGTSFSVGGSRETIDGFEDAPPVAAMRPDPRRRGAALPAGAKPRMIIRKRDGSEPPGPPSGRLPHAEGSSPRMPQVREPLAVDRLREPSAGSAGPQSSPAMGVPQGRPRLAPIGTKAARAQPQPNPNPNANPLNPHAPGAGPHASGRIPVAAPAPGMQSAGRVPAAPPAAVPADRPSSGRLPLPIPMPPPSDRRLPLPAPPPSKPDQAQGRPAPSAAKLPVPPARPPMPSVSDASGPPSDGRRRAPLPLPSQAVRPKKD